MRKALCFFFFFLNSLLCWINVDSEASFSNCKMRVYIFCMCVYLESSNSLSETRLQACVASVSGFVACFGPTQENCSELLTLRVEGTTPQGCLNTTLLKVQVLTY